MSALYKDSYEITHYVKATRQPHQNKIVTTLLDGSDHVQSIGDPVVRYELEITVDLINRDIIDDMDSAGELLTLIDEGMTHYGRILYKEPWKKLNNNILQTTLTLSVEVV